MYSECLRVRTLARASSPKYRGQRGWAGSEQQNTFHSSRSGTPLRGEDWSGRTPPGEPRFLRGRGACQSPRAVKTSLPSLSQASGVEAAAAAALPGAAALRSAGRWLVAGPQSPLEPRTSRLRRLPAPAPAAFCLHRAGARLASPVPPAGCFSPASPSRSHLLPAPAAGPRRPADLLDHSPRTPLPERCLLSTKLRLPLQPPSRAETKSSGGFFPPGA